MAPLPETRNHPRLTVGLALALALVTALVFLPVRHHDFLNWDDQHYVTENDLVIAGLTPAGITWAFTQSHAANWHPVTWLSHMVDCDLYGLDPAGHHLTNVGLHAFNAALLFLLLRLLTGSVWRSLFVAALFALHPLRVESVAWVSERKDVLSTFFGFLSLLCYARYARSQIENRKSKIVNYLAALLAFALGLMSKPMLVTLPFVMLLLDYWPLRRMQSAIWLEKLPFLALAAVSCAITIWAQHTGGAVAALELLPLGARLQHAVLAYVGYLQLFFWPAHLLPLYPYAVKVGWGSVAAALAFLLLVTGLAWRSRYRFPFLLTGWLWFLGTLVPVIGIVQVGSQALADRYTYLPLIGISLALIWLLGELATKIRAPRFAVAVASAVILVLLGWRTTVQLAYWKNTETLFRHNLAFSRQSALAHYRLGSYLVEHAQVAEGRQLITEALRLQPSFPEAMASLALALDYEKRYPEAVAQYEAALNAAADNAGVMNNLAWLLATCPDASVRDGPAAVRLATRACEFTLYSKPVFIGTLAAAQAEAGDLPAAITTAERAAALADKLGLPEVAARNRELLALFRAGKAAHGGLPGAK